MGLEERYLSLIHILCSHFHAVLDYPDEDIEDFGAAELGGTLDRAGVALRELLATYEKGRHLRQGVRAVLLGKPNAGKSSLLNRLAGYDREMCIRDRIMVGGNFDKKSQSFYGTRALEFGRSYHVDKAFFSCRSINYKSGVMDSNEKTSDIRRMIIDQSDRAYLCVDSSKFGANSFVSICNFDRCV